MVAGKVMQPFMYDMPVTNQQGQVEYEDVLMFIRDGIKFVQNFAGIIDKSTPHVYLSALPFSPCKSMLAKCLATSFSGVAQVAVGQHDDWPRIQHALQGHTSSVLSVAFSPDGRHIMSGSCDETICHDRDIRSPCTLLSDRVHVFAVCLQYVLPFSISLYLSCSATDQ